MKVMLHRILVKPEKVEESDDLIRRARAAGLQVQLDKREEKAVEVGFVEQVGPTAFKDYGQDPYVLPIGSKVVFAKYAGKEVKVGDITYLILNDEDIVAILEE